MFAALTFPQRILGASQWIITSCVPIYTVRRATIVGTKHYYRIVIHSSGFQSVQHLKQDEYSDEKQMKHDSL